MGGVPGTNKTATVRVPKKAQGEGGREGGGRGDGGGLQWPVYGTDTCDYCKVDEHTHRGRLPLEPSNSNASTPPPVAPSVHCWTDLPDRCSLAGLTRGPRLAATTERESPGEAPGTTSLTRPRVMVGGDGSLPCRPIAPGGEEGFPPVATDERQPPEGPPAERARAAREPLAAVGGST